MRKFLPCGILVNAIALTVIMLIGEVRAHPDGPQVGPPVGAWAITAPASAQKFPAATSSVDCAGTAPLFGLDPYAVIMMQSATWKGTGGGVTGALGLWSCPCPVGSPATTYARGFYRLSLRDNSGSEVDFISVEML